MRPKNRLELEKTWEQQHAESDRILASLGISDPRCGFSIGMGWMPVVEDALKQMVAAGWDRDLRQVKQKFCGLRIYIGAGEHDDVDNLVKRLFRKPVEKLASSNRLPSKLRIKLWDLSRTRLLRATKPSKIYTIIREAEEICDHLCEVCGRERENKGPGFGWALCNSCGEDE